MTLAEFLIVKASAKDDQCECRKDNTAEETMKEMKFSSKEESMERASRSADRMVTLHNEVVKASWETFMAKMEKIPKDADDAGKQVEELFKGLMDTAIKTTQLALLSQLMC